MEPLEVDNPLRQVIINTHSPAVVEQMPESSLLVAVEREHLDEQGRRLQGMDLRCLADTWRAEAGAPTASLGELLAYLNPIPPTTDELLARFPKQGARRVVDRPDVGSYLPFAEG